ncbi:hypothetical protein LOZ53_004645 [Ophidiomyces ophidiicola]|nr:hypothetical protein LOZ51_006104 [Ophidiomyces ophidiicola]KAI1986587.1 hypothetical protein LOZ53_004645 [Ophidiomyces ophidiicola]
MTIETRTVSAVVTVIPAEALTSETTRREEYGRSEFQFSPQEHALIHNVHTKLPEPHELQNPGPAHRLCIGVLGDDWMQIVTDKM